MSDAYCITMKLAAILTELEQKPTFTAKLFSLLIRRKPNYANLALHRLKRNNQVAEIERGIYTVHKDAFTVATGIAWPSYISLWSALRYHNLTEQVPHSVQVIITKRKRNMKLKFGNNEIIFKRTSPKYFFGYDKTNYKGLELFIADPEKTIIDCILFKKVSINEIHEILLKNRKNINPRKLMNYAVSTKNKALIKRLGFLLEKIGIDSYKTLQKHVYPLYTPLGYNAPKKGRHDNRWKIIENVILC